MSINGYDNHLPKIFTHRLPCSLEYARAAVALLVESEDLTPWGSSFAVAANLPPHNEDGLDRILWLSNASVTRLRNAGIDVPKHANLRTNSLWDSRE